jgi:hypothetical protein
MAIRTLKNGLFFDTSTAKVWTAQPTIRAGVNGDERVDEWLYHGPDVTNRRLLWVHHVERRPKGGSRRGRTFEAWTAANDAYARGWFERCNRPSANIRAIFQMGLLWH